MAHIRIPGTAQRYRDTETGAELSRRQAEKIRRPIEVRERDIRYRKSVRERATARAFIARDMLANNKRYWAQRYAEQYAVRHGMDDRQALVIARQPGSQFNRLWAAAEREGFDGGVGSAWDKLAMAAGAKGGYESEEERRRYLSVIGWHTRNDEVGRQIWLARDEHGQFLRHPNYDGE